LSFLWLRPLEMPLREKDRRERNRDCFLLSLELELSRATMCRCVMSSWMGRPPAFAS
jgi:hypothetical protein